MILFRKESEDHRVTRLACEGLRKREVKNENNNFLFKNWI